MELIVNVLPQSLPFHARGIEAIGKKTHKKQTNKQAESWAQQTQ